jgi:hypothetical protein
MGCRVQMTIEWWFVRDEMDSRLERASRSRRVQKPISDKLPCRGFDRPSLKV